MKWGAILKRKKTLVLVGAIIVFGLILFYFIQTRSPAGEVKIEGIENFSLDDSDADYVLLYPADWRVSQDFTLVKEVTKTGEVLHQYRIIDEDFRRASIHQKPNDSYTLYMSLFGEPVIQNWFYTYDLQTHRFKQIPLDYFQYETGVNHIMHYGEDVIFNTIASHKTGDQIFNPVTHDFKVSMSNFTTEVSYETEWGLEPSWTPIVQFNGHLIYAGAGKVNDAGYSVDTFVAFINEENESVESTNFDHKGVEFAPIFANEKHAFILGIHTGELIVLDRNFDDEVFTPYENVEKRELYYVHDAFLMIDYERALQVITEHDRTVDMLGILTLSDEPRFTPLEKEYIHPDRHYRILYQDLDKGVIFLIESEEGASDGHVLVIDNKEFDLIDRFPVEYSQLLDMVVKR